MYRHFGRHFPFYVSRDLTMAYTLFYRCSILHTLCPHFADLALYQNRQSNQNVTCKLVEHFLLDTFYRIKSDVSLFSSQTLEALKILSHHRHRQWWRKLETLFSSCSHICAKQIATFAMNAGEMLTDREKRKKKKYNRENERDRAILLLLFLARLYSTVIFISIIGCFSLTFVIFSLFWYIHLTSFHFYAMINSEAAAKTERKKE